MRFLRKPAPGAPGPSRILRRAVLGVCSLLVVVVVAGVILVMVAPRVGPLRTTAQTAPGPTTTKTTGARPSPPPVCPLSGTPAPHGVVPNHPAVAVKVENLPAARPQYGLNAADIVYEEPVEGGITRFIVVYQCNQAARIEPVRSSRLVDALILPQLGRPVFGFAGGINPSVNAVDHSGARIVNFLTDPAPFARDPARYAPHNLETSTTALLRAAGNPKGAPKPIFAYSAAAPPGAVATALHLDFSYASDVWWRWDATTQRYLRFYGTVPATLGGGGQIQAANVVVEDVVVTPSPYVEDATGIHENYVGVVGSGPAEVARNGVVIKGRWVHPSPAAPTQLLDSAGKLIPLAPGPTWVELFPTTSTASPAP